MFEVELKAWLDDWNTTISKLSGFASFLDDIDKEDTYWKLSNGKDGNPITIRLRKEISKNNTQFLVTYKLTKKRVSETSKDSVYEVNEEHEFIISSITEFELILINSGFIKTLQKHKKVSGWQYGNFHIELCYVEKVGNFIEIETFSDTNDKKNTEILHNELLNVLNKCGVNSDKIEPRYYSELLSLGNK